MPIKGVAHFFVRNQSCPLSGFVMHEQWAMSSLLIFFNCAYITRESKWLHRGIILPERKCISL